MMNKNLNSDKSKQILMIIASSDFRDEEFLEPKQIFENNNFNVTVASSSMKEAKGMLRVIVKPEILIKNVDVEQYDAVVFVGGSGAVEYFESSVAIKIAKAVVSKNKLLAAICIAPNILANAGLLKGITSTCYNSENLVKKGANFTGNPVEQDGLIITGKDPESCEEFANKIVNALI